MRSTIRAGRICGLPLVVLAVVVTGQAGFGQESPDPAATPEAPASPDFAALRTTALNNADDRAKVGGWIDAQVQQLFAADDPLADGASFYSGLKQHIVAPDATTGFKDQMIQMLAAAFTSQYKPAAPNANKPNPIPAVFMLVVLKLHDHPSALPCYRASLSDRSSGVRLVAADGLVSSKIPAEEWQTLLPAVEKLATDEPNPVTLSRQYALLMKDGGAPAAGAVPAILNVLSARLVRFEQTEELPSIVDANVVAWLAEKGMQNADDQTKKRIMLQTARLMADAVYAYLNHGLDEKRAQLVERVIFVAEKVLKNLAKPPADSKEKQPDVVKAMCDGGENRNALMEAACAAWIGTKETAGFLNGPPFGLEAGLGIKRPEPKDQPATSE